ncbi:hypothetical protein ACO0M4_24160 [Streptomyces sp. RGM 3693]|uniref:hypothetical protein n=1 Tax=Streptomyces sp. RGM 3693 TaxID=3413284 RepID=UPI003D282F1E
MRSPQLALCAAVAVCAVTTVPAYATDDGRGHGTAQTTIAAPAAHGPHRTPPTGPHPAGPDTTRATDPAGSVRAHTAPALTARGPLMPRRVTARRELSSTSAVALVLAGGAILVIAGQLLRLRLRLRRERQGSGSGDER